MTSATTIFRRPKTTSGLWGWVTTVDHKKIGIMYGYTAFFFLIVGGLEALLLRLQLAGPEGQILSQAEYNSMFTMHGTINISNSRFKFDTEPIESGCGCYTCRNFSRAYLRHLYMAKELLAYRLNTIHNMHYYINLMKHMRKAICEGEFGEFRRDFYRKISS